MPKFFIQLSVYHKKQEIYNLDDHQLMDFFFKSQSKYAIGIFEADINTDGILSFKIKETFDEYRTRANNSTFIYDGKKVIYRKIINSSLISADTEHEIKTDYDRAHLVMFVEINFYKHVRAIYEKYIEESKNRIFSLFEQRKSNNTRYRLIILDDSSNLAAQSLLRGGPDDFESRILYFHEGRECAMYNYTLDLDEIKFNSPNSRQICITLKITKINYKDVDTDNKVGDKVGVWSDIIDFCLDPELIMDRKPQCGVNYGCYTTLFIEKNLYDQIVIDWYKRTCLD